MAEHALAIANEEARRSGSYDSFAGEIAGRVEAVEQIHARMEAHIRDELAHGDLLSVGRRGGGEFEMIPADFWPRARVNFDGLSSEYRGTRYTDIYFVVYVPEKHDAPPTKRGRGRPRKHPLVREAALIALRDHTDFLDWPATEWEKEIRRILKNHPNFEDRRGSLPEYETIRREINKMRDEAAHGAQ